MAAARCAFIAGATMTSNVLASAWAGIPGAGTMAHSYVTAFSSELEAFRAFARAFPRNTTLLLDTYDTVAAAHKAVIVAREMEAAGARLAGVRLDSGDLLALSREVRRILDAAGCPGVRIVASGGLDEHDIAGLVAAGAPVDSFGVGTRLNVSADAPTLDLVYKLVRYGGRDVLKLSQGKETWVGAKALYRSFVGGCMAGDVLALRDEPPPKDGEALLQVMMRDGELLGPPPSLATIRRHCLAQLALLPQELKLLKGHAEYPVAVSAGLRARQERAVAEVSSYQPS
jgi:nicotinate phosphoribosyltransferase